MGRQTALTAATYNRLVLDAGAVYKNYGIGVRTITLNTVIATDAVAVKIGSVTTTFTFVAAAPSGNEVLVGISDDASATNLAAAINALTGVSAVAAAKVVTVTGDNALINFAITTPDTTMTIGTNGLNTEIIGATRGGSTYTIESEYREMPVDGAKGPVKGDTRITRVNATLAANFIEVSTDILKLALPGSSSADYPTITPTHDQITRALDIALTDYLSNVVIVADVSGGAVPVICGISNVIANSNLEMAYSDNEEGVVAITFKGSFDPSTLDSEPWFIRYPKAS